ncbi:MAG: methyltransferase domain-containing protein [Acidimicrobiales bacterium]
MPSPGPDLGLGADAGARVGFARRLLARVAWPVLRHQVAYNHVLADQVAQVRATLAEQDADRRAGDLAPAVADVQADLGLLARRVDDLAAVLERQGWTIEAAVSKLDSHGYALDALAPTIESQGASLEALAPTIESQGASLEALRLALDRAQSLASELSDSAERQGWAIEAVVSKLDSQGYAVTSLEEDLAAVRRDLELVERQSFARYHDGMGALRTEIGELAARVETGADVVAADLAERRSAEEVLERRIGASDEILEHKLAPTRIRLAQVDLVLGRLRESLPGVPDPSELSGLPGAFEHIRAAFEDALRDPLERAEERAAAYLGDVVGVGTSKPVLDIGAGRGEWLERLRKAGLEAYGIEPDAARASGAPEAAGVVVADVVGHLRGLAEASLGSITAVRVVGYLAPEGLVELFDLAAHAIEPGGLLVVDTTDPLRAAPSASPRVSGVPGREMDASFLAFLAEARGFLGVEVRPLAGRGGPSPDAPGAWEYALLARRP